MRTKLKRILSTVLACVMLISLLPASALAGPGDTNSQQNSDGSYKIYYYTLVPGKTLADAGDNNSDEVWNGMGVGSITNVNAPSSYNLKTLITEGTHTEPTSYPDITVDGNTYQYAATGSNNANKQGYYTIEWIRTIVSEGANKGANQYNPAVGSATKTFHRDGQVFLNETNYCTVTFKIQEPGSSEFTIQEDYSVRVPMNTSESKLTKPETTDKTVDSVPYQFDGWYTDMTCTTKANFDGTVTGNTTYYGKYVPKTYTVTWVDGNGDTIYTEDYEYGETPVYDEDNYGLPEKDATAEFSYTFTGWMPEIVAVTEDATYTAQFSATTNQYAYTIEYYYDGEINSTKTESGTAAFGSEITTYTDKSEENYVLEKVDPNLLIISNVEANNVIKVYYVTKDTSVDVTKVVTSVANPAGEPYDTKDTAKVGDTITWTITVTNNGNVSQTLTLADTLSNNQPVTVTDDKTGNEVTGNITIAAKTTSTYTATYTVQIGDSGDTLVNTAILKDGDTPKDGDTAPGVKIDPALTVDKTVDKTTASVGDKLTYIITVTSNASVELKNVVVTDELLGMTGNKAITIESLAAGGTWSETYTYTVKSSDAGKKLVNTAIASTEDGQELDRDSSDGTSIRVPSRPSQPALNTEDHVAYIIGYDDGTVKPTNNITRAEVATIFFRLLTDDSRAAFWSQTNSYSDVSSNNWFNNAVSTLSNAGIISGYPDGTFKPNAPITRAEFAAIATRFSDASYTGRCTFTDVPADHWAANAIALAQDLGWINGYSDGTFKPNQPITRAEAMTLINRVLERAVDRDHMLADMVTWTDNRPGSWYYEAVQEATNSHEYTRTGVYVPSQSFCYENWVEILEAPDWAALENAWSTANGQ